MHSHQLLTGSHTLLLGRLKDFAFLVPMTFRNIGCSLVLISSPARPPPPQKGATWVIKSLGVWRGTCRRRGRTPRLHLIISHTFSCICDSDKLQGTGEGKDEGEREKGKRWSRCTKTTVFGIPRNQIRSQADTKTKLTQPINLRRVLPMSRRHAWTLNGLL